MPYWKVKWTFDSWFESWRLLSYYEMVNIMKSAVIHSWRYLTSTYKHLLTDNNTQFAKLARVILKGSVGREALDILCWFL